MKPAKSARTSSTGIACSTARSRKAGTAWTVTVESDPERADADTGDVEDVGVLVGGALEH